MKLPEAAQEGFGSSFGLYLFWVWWFGFIVLQFRVGCKKPTVNLEA